MHIQDIANHLPQVEDNDRLGSYLDMETKPGVDRKVRFGSVWVGLMDNAPDLLMVASFVVLVYRTCNLAV